MVMCLWKFNGAKCLRKAICSAREKTGNWVPSQLSAEPRPTVNKTIWRHYPGARCSAWLRLSIHLSFSSPLTQSKIISHSRVHRKQVLCAINQSYRWPLLELRLPNPHPHPVFFSKPFESLDNAEPNNYFLSIFLDIQGIRVYICL